VAIKANRNFDLKNGVSGAWACNSPKDIQSHPLHHLPVFYVIIDRSINPAISYSALKYPMQSNSTDGNFAELTSILIEERYLQKYNNHLDQKITYTVSGAADSANCFNNEDCAHFST